MIFNFDWAILSMLENKSDVFKVMAAILDARRWALASLYFFHDFFY